MPNHVVNKIIFAAEKAQEIVEAICPNGELDFERLVPSPPQKFQGDLGPQEKEDFRCNWWTWNIENWGTKWNAYDSFCEIDAENAFIQFHTAWTVPYPILAAFNNRFQIPFEHRYCCERGEFWGVEIWDESRFHAGRITRREKRFNQAEDERRLCIELWDYDPESPDDD